MAHNWQNCIQSIPDMENEQRKEKNNEKILTRFVISTNNLIIWSYSTKICSCYLKDDANPLMYSITWYVKQQEQQKQ